MTGKQALEEIQSLILEAKKSGSNPEKVLIPADYENALITLTVDDIGTDIKEKISIEGVQKAFPSILGIKTEWGADKLTTK